MLALSSLMRSDENFKKMAGWILIIFMAGTMLFFWLYDGWFPSTTSTAGIWRGFPEFFLVVTLIALAPTAICLQVGATTAPSDGSQIPRRYLVSLVIGTFAFWCAIFGAPDFKVRDAAGESIYEVFGLATPMAGLFLADLVLIMRDRIRMKFGRAPDN